MRSWLEIYHEDAEELTSVELAQLGYWDPVFYCKYFLAELFSEPMPWVHRALLAILLRKCSFLEKYGELDKILTNFALKEAGGEDLQLFYLDDEGKIQMRQRRFTNIMLPRGASKTTIAGIAVPTYNIVYQDVDFMVYVSEAGPHSQMQLDTVKSELSHNEKFLAVFGLLRPKQTADEKWSQNMFETSTGVAMAARGRGAQVRGLLHHGRRPRVIIVDDLEDKDSVRTPERRDQTREWFYGDLLPALPKIGKGNSTVVNLATTLHPQGLGNVLQRDPQWTTILFGAKDAQGDLLWASWMNEKDLAKEKRSYTLQGLLHVYYMEFFNQLIAVETQIFKQEYIHYGTPKGELRSAIYVDPAISNKRRADRTFITVAGIAEDGFIYVLEEWAKRGATPRELIDKYFELAIYYNCDRTTGHGVEAIAYQAALVHLMKEEMFRKGHYFEVIPVTHARRQSNIPAKKEERIQAILQPRYAAGYIKHVKPLPELEAELLNFSLAGLSHDDGPDSLAGCVSLLDPFAPSASGDIDLATDQYESLDDIVMLPELDRYGRIPEEETQGFSLEYGRWAQ